MQSLPEPVSTGSDALAPQATGQASARARGATAPLVPVELITGFLGSGKSTLVNRLLGLPAFAGTVVVVNEFGAVGVDQALVASASDGVVLMDSGCLCCAMSGTLGETLADLFERRAGGRLPWFRRVVVETSGLAHPGPLIAGLLGDSALKSRCELGRVVTVVDGVNGRATLDRYSEARRQVSLADRLLISKTDVAEADRVTELTRAVRELNPTASVSADMSPEALARLFEGPALRAEALQVEGAWGQAPLRRQYGYEAPVHGEAFGQLSSHTLAMPDLLDWPRYAACIQGLQKLGRRLLRCKGLLAVTSPDTPWLVQGVQGYFAPPRRLDAWPEGVPRGFLVCIGEGIARAELQAILESENG